MANPTLSIAGSVSPSAFKNAGLRGDIHSPSGVISVVIGCMQSSRAAESESHPAPFYSADCKKKIKIYRSAERATCFFVGRLWRATSCNPGMRRRQPAFDPVE